MKTLVAWRVLIRGKAVTALAVSGVFAAISFAFLQLGFYSSVPTSGRAIYEAMDFDIVLASRAHVYQVRPKPMPRRRLYQALGVPEVEAAIPFYQNYGRWRNISDGVLRSMFVMGIDTEQVLFMPPSIEEHRQKLRALDVAIADDSSKPEYGAAPGAVVEINDRKVEIIDRYTLGRGFISSCIVIVSDLNFLRIFPGQFDNQIHLGFIRVREGHAVDQVVDKLKSIMPSDIVVYSREAFMRHEVDYWLKSTSTGLVFGFGVGVAAVVGCAILFQTLSTLIRRHLPEYATLKAMGYRDRQLAHIVFAQALVIAIAAYTIAVPATYGLYDLARGATNLPISMTAERMIVVFVMTIVICLSSAAISLNALRKADPVDLF